MADEAQLIDLINMREYRKQKSFSTGRETSLPTHASMDRTIGKLLYVNRHPEMAPVRADRERLRVHAQLVLSFLAGGVTGAAGFKVLGYVSTLPLAVLLLLLVLRPLLEDGQRWRRG